MIYYFVEAQDNQLTLAKNPVTAPENAFYLLYLPTANITFCFDTRGALENGGLRATRWPSSPFKCFAKGDDGTVYVGSASGVGDYSGYQDNGSAYNLRYYSNPLSFGDPSRIKFVKKIVPTFIGGSSTTAFVKWGYDFNESYSTFPQAIADFSPAEYGIAEYGIAEYSQSFVAVLKKRHQRFWSRYCCYYWRGSRDRSGRVFTTGI